MRWTLLLPAGLTCCVVLGLSRAVSADDFQWLGRASSDWTDGDNWEKVSGASARTYPNHVTDDATMESGGRYYPVVRPGTECVTMCNLNVGGGVCMTVHGCVVVTCRIKIAPGGELKIESSGSVTQTGDATDRIGGRISLVGPGSTLAFEADVVLTPWSAGRGEVRGSICGRDSSAVIEIMGGKTLMNRITIEGEMKITVVGPGISNGVLANNGSVVANAVSGTLLLDSGVTLSDSRNANTWEARSSSGARLQFREAATGLSGTFILDDCATFDFDADVTTIGPLEGHVGGASSGTVDASATDVCFDWDGAGAPTQICNSSTTADCQSANTPSIPQIENLLGTLGLQEVAKLMRHLRDGVIPKNSSSVICGM